MKKELLAGNWLGDDHINLAQELLNEEYPNLHGLQSPLLCQNDSFCPIAGNSIQIHFVSTSIKRHMFFPGSQIELFCECRMPETYDNMIQCDQCYTWFHIKCMNLQCIPNEWYCTNCRCGLAA